MAPITTEPAFNKDVPLPGALKILSLTVKSALEKDANGDSVTVPPEKLLLLFVSVSLVEELALFIVSPDVAVIGADINKPPVDPGVMLGVVPEKTKAPVPDAATVWVPLRLADERALSVTVTPVAMVAVPAVADVPAKPNRAKSALVNVTALVADVPAELVVHRAVVVSQAPVSVPKPAVAPFASK